MQSKYIYAGTYSSMLIDQLPTANQRELLLATTSIEEIRKILQDTCFAPYLDTAHTLSENLEQFVFSQKNKLVQISPDPTIFDVLFLRYDYANVKLIHKALEAKETEDEVLAKCSNLGTIPAAKLFKTMVAGQLTSLSPQLSEALKEATSTTTRTFADVFDQAYLNHTKAIAGSTKNKFVSEYVTTVIDLHNLQMRLRSFVHTESEAIIVQGEIVAGGTLSASDLESLETILKRVNRFGGEKNWRDAITNFSENHDFTAIDRASDNYLAQFLKAATIDPHTPAPLFAYFLSVLEHTQFVRAVIAARNVGLSETELRALVRNSIHDYAY